jgi:hypothetical protein
MKVEKKNPFMPKIWGQHHENYNFHGAWKLKADWENIIRVAQKILNVSQPF